MKRDIRLLVILFAFLYSGIAAQTRFDKSKISFPVKLIVWKLDSYDIVSGALIGKAPRKPKQYKVFEKLKSKADENELYELTNHPNPNVRAYAFWGLVEINSSNTLKVISKNQSDTTIIEYKYGCTTKSKRLIGFMTSFVPSYSKMNNIILSTEQNALLKRELDINLFGNVHAK